MVSRDTRPTIIKFGEHVSSALARPPNKLTPDFIALRQTVHEKSITDFFTPFTILAPQGDLLAKVISLVMYSKAPSVKLTNFVPF